MSAAAPRKDGPANNLPKTTAQGAATTVWAAVAPEFEGRGGLYLEDCGVAAPWSEANPRRGVKDYALDPAAAGRLWELSETAVRER